MTNAIFILGAGFNVDASTNMSGTTYSYPIVKDLAQKCFGMLEPLTDKSIEQLFQEAMDEKRSEPFQCLYHLLMEADNYIGQELTTKSISPISPYRLLLEHFPNSHFLTFNYDALLEMLLFSLGRWRPDYGYGIPVHAELENLVAKPTLPEKSNNLVLHLHGTFCVYPAEFYLKQNGRSFIEWITPLYPPQFMFDPDSIVHRFFPFRRAFPCPSYEYPYQRVIAPMPSKAPELTRPFIKSTYTAALDHVARADTAVAIGYRFGEYDIESYKPILRTIADRSLRLVIVSPSANIIAASLKYGFGIRSTPIAIGFRDWALRGFPLPNPGEQKRTERNLA